MRAGLTVVLVAAILAAAAAAAQGAPRRAWPPPSGTGTLFAHVGEEHLTDPDGPRILPRVVAAIAAFRPRAVLTSGDKANDGTVENLSGWLAAMAPLRAASVPLFAAVGNHDRKKKPGFPDGIDPTGDLGNYQTVFAGEPYPFGDGPPPADPGFAPRTRPAGDPPGASSHYAFDVDRTRWIVLDNSCFTFSVCDGQQSPPFPDSSGAGGQLDFLRREAADARARGMTVLVQMHMPTEDPRPGHTQPTPRPHTMGEGSAPDNAQFEAAAAQAGVSAVFAGHIKGQWTYDAGGVRYFTDGGGGGAVYVGSGEQTGVDSGYWHGFRLVRVQPDGSLSTDAVPIFAPGGIAISGPDVLAAGATATFAAAGRQPTQAGPAVDLSLRPPAADRPNVANLPTPAYVWHSSNPGVLRALAGPGDDPRDDASHENQSGRFRARCPGRARLAVVSGWERSTAGVTVPSRPGRLLAGRPRVSRRRGRVVAAVRLAQRVRLAAALRRHGRTVARGRTACRPRGVRRIRVPTAGLRRGRYVLALRLLSDRAPVRVRLALRVGRRLSG